MCTTLKSRTTFDIFPKITSDSQLTSQLFPLFRSSTLDTFIATKLRFLST